MGLASVSSQITQWKDWLVFPQCSWWMWSTGTCCVTAQSRSLDKSLPVSDLSFPPLKAGNIYLNKHLWGKDVINLSCHIMSYIPVFHPINLLCLICHDSYSSLWPFWRSLNLNFKCLRLSCQSLYEIDKNLNPQKGEQCWIGSPDIWSYSWQPWSCQENQKDLGSTVWSTPLTKWIDFFHYSVVVQLLSHVLLFVTPWTAAHQASLPFTISWSLLKLRSNESVTPSNHLILCCPLLLLVSIFPSIRVFSSELTLPLRWPKYWSFSFSISPFNEYSGLISFRIDWLNLLCSPRDSQKFSPAPGFKSINSLVLSLLYGPTLTSVLDYWKKHSFDYTELCQQSDVFNTLSRFVITFLPRSKHLLILWLQSLSQRFWQWFWSPRK